MPSPTPELSKQSPAKRSRRTEGTVYVFAVTSLATFLVGLALWRPPVVGYSARAIVAWSPRPSENGAEEVDSADRTERGPALTELIAELRSDETLSAVATEFGIFEPGDAAYTSKQNAWLRKVRRHLNIRGEKETDGVQTTLILEYDGRDRDYATEFVDALSRHCVRIGEISLENRKTTIAAERREAARAVVDAKGRLTRANAAVEAFVAEHLAERQRLPDAPQATPIPQYEDPGGYGPGGPNFQDEPSSLQNPQLRDAGSDRWNASPTSDGSTQNSDWTKLTQDLDLLKSQIRRLMDGATEAHTHAGNLEQRATGGLTSESEPESRLGSSNQFGSASAEELDTFAAGPSTVPDGAAGETVESRKNSTDELLDEIHRLPQYAVAREEHSAAEATYNEALATQVRVEASDWSETAGPPRIIQNARIARRLGGNPGIGSVLPLGWISVTIGCCFAVLCRLASTSRTFRSVDDVALALDAGIVGAITTSDGPEISSSDSDGKSMVRNATLAGEAALAAIVVLMAFFAATDHFFARRFLRDPFSAYAEAIDRVTSWMM